MNVFTTTLVFLLVSFVAFFLFNRYVKRWLPDTWLMSRWAMGILSILFAFAAVYFITRWGFRPAVITINLRQNVDNPLRWINWLISALSFGVAQSFLLEVLQNQSQSHVEETPLEEERGRRADFL